MLKVKKFLSQVRHSEKKYLKMSEEEITKVLHNIPCITQQPERACSPLHAVFKYQKDFSKNVLELADSKVLQVVNNIGMQIEQLTNITDTEVITYIQEKIIPYYQGNFQISDDQELSFLPLPLRLKTYWMLFRAEKQKEVGQAFFNRAGLTMAQMGRRLMNFADACMLVNWLHDISKPDKYEIACRVLKSYVHNNHNAPRARFKLLKQQGYNLQDPLAELRYSYTTLSGLQHIKDVGAADLVVELIFLYYRNNSAARSFLASKDEEKTAGLNNSALSKEKRTYYAQKMYQKALKHSEKRKFKDALHYLNQAIMYNPTNAKYYEERYYVYGEMGKPLEANQDIARALCLGGLTSEHIEKLDKIQAILDSALLLNIGSIYWDMAGLQSQALLYQEMARWLYWAVMGKALIPGPENDTYITDDQLTTRAKDILFASDKNTQIKNSSAPDIKISVDDDLVAKFNRADRGDITAIHELVDLCQKHAIPKDIKKAYYFKKWLPSGTDTQLEYLADFFGDQWMAFELLVKAALLGSAQAYYQLGQIFNGSAQVIANKELSALCFQKANKLGFKASAVSEKEIGVANDSEPDDIVALVKESKKGNVDAQFKLAMKYLADENNAANYSQAVQWLQKAAAQNHADAQYYMGYVYLQGLGVSQDQQQAFDYFVKAAKLGHGLAQCRVGEFYINITSLLKIDYEKGIYWLKEAAKQGIARAQFQLGNLYRFGRGVDKDVNQAKVWYQMAAEQGSIVAQATIKHLWG